MSIKEMILYTHGSSEYSQLFHFSFPIFLLDFIFSFEEIVSHLKTHNRKNYEFSPFHIDIPA